MSLTFSDRALPGSDPPVHQIECFHEVDANTRRDIEPISRS
jgi:hypothetical protein